MISNIARYIRRPMTSARGAIDLASILIGVLVTGIIAAGILSTVFMVVPWSQDESAKRDLDTVRLVESVAYAHGGGGGAAGKYQTFSELVANDLIQDSSSVSVATDALGTCYTAVSLSASGSVFWADSYSSEINQYVDGVSSSLCVDLAGLVAVLEPNGGASAAADPSWADGAVELVYGGGGFENETYYAPGSEPQASSAPCFPSVTYATFGEVDWDLNVARAVSSATAWVDGVDYALDLTSLELKMYSYHVSGEEPNGEASFEWDDGYPGIGDNSQELNYAFYEDSYIELTVAGCAETNYLHLTTPPSANPYRDVGPTTDVTTTTDQGFVDFTESLGGELGSGESGMVQLWYTGDGDPQNQAPASGDVPVTLPLTGGYDVTIDWGDGTIENYSANRVEESGWFSSDVLIEPTHTYTDGLLWHAVTVSGTFEGYGLYQHSWTPWGNFRLVAITEWHGTGTTQLRHGFARARNLETVVEHGFITNVTNMYFAFTHAGTARLDVSDWDVSSVTEHYGAFKYSEVPVANQPTWVS